MSKLYQAVIHFEENKYKKVKFGVFESGKAASKAALNIANNCYEAYAIQGRPIRHPYPRKGARL